MRRATLGQSVALCVLGDGRPWHPTQYVTTSAAPGDPAPGRSAAVRLSGGSATLAAASSRASRDPAAAPALPLSGAAPPRQLSATHVIRTVLTIECWSIGSPCRRRCPRAPPRHDRGAQRRS